MLVSVTNINIHVALTIRFFSTYVHLIGAMLLPCSSTLRTQAR